MSYSARQQYCLNIMGLVAWTRGYRADGHVMSGASVNADKAEQIAARTRHPVSRDCAPQEHAPYDCATLLQWLSKQPLVPFLYRGSSVSCTGSEQATLAVVCLHSQAMYKNVTPALPLTPDCSSLLNQMLRAIELPATAIRQCVISSQGSDKTERRISPEISPDTRGQGLDVVVTPAVKALLVLDVAEQWHDTDMDYAPLPGSSLPVWRIPHPQILLTNTSLKRRAWENLKALKQVL